MQEDEGQGSDEVFAQGQEGSVAEVTEPEGTGINPAWSDLLGVVPSQLHSQVTPHLTKWDQGVQQKIQQVHSQYEPYKPFIEKNVAPDQLEYGLGLLQAIENNPKEVLEALQAYIGETDEQGQNNQQQPDGSNDETPEWMKHPEWQKTQEMVQTMAQFLVQQRQSEQEARENKELEEKLTNLRETVGDFDEDWVLTKMLNDDKLTLEDAVKAYKEFEQGLVAKMRQPGPKILSAGGSVPTQGLNPKNLDDKGRRALVVQMLENAKAQQG